MAGGGGLVPGVAGNPVRIVVAGDEKTGKSSLIVTAVSKNFPSNVPPVLPPTRLPEDLYPDLVPVTIIDTSSSTKNRGKLVEEMRRADVVVLTYACDRPETFDRLSNYWLPELRRLEVRVPVIVVGCMIDERRCDQQDTELIMLLFREIEACCVCSALYNIQIPEVFYSAQKAVLYPKAPLFDEEQHVFKPRCVRALKRIFILCDHDRDGALSDEELNEFQVKCFNAPLLPFDIANIKRAVQGRFMKGVDDRGLTSTDFVFYHGLFLEEGKLERIWAVLRKFGYNNELRLRDDQLPPPVERDKSVELSNEAVEFLRKIFFTYDVDRDGALRSAELEDLFSTAPKNPFNESPYAEMTGVGGLSLYGFISLWAHMTLLDPIRSVENLIYIGYGDDPLSAIRVTPHLSIPKPLAGKIRNVFHRIVNHPLMFISVGAVAAAMAAYCAEKKNSSS